MSEQRLRKKHGSVLVVQVHLYEVKHLLVLLRNGGFYKKGFCANKTNLYYSLKKYYYSLVLCVLIYRSRGDVK
jgi:hypothetical protein